MVLRVRKVKTGSGKVAVQVVVSGGHRVNVVKHLGTANNPDEVKQLESLAINYIVHHQDQLALIPEAVYGTREPERHHLAIVEHLRIGRVTHKFAYEVLCNWYRFCGFSTLSNDILRDLAVMRVVEPVSKLKSLELLHTYFGIRYPKNKIYGHLVEIGKLKSLVEKVAFRYAGDTLSLDASLVFYDVTTLYFETFADDALRKTGFSKDNKPHQPQIVIGLVVDRQGFPLGYDMFSGNKFEGQTFTPTILQFKQTHRIRELTVVADAAMVSETNMEELRRHGLNYIVAARVANLPRSDIEEISRDLDHQEGRYVTRVTTLGKLICDYSRKRAAKDRSDRNRHLQKALVQLQHPERITRRSRFIKTGKLKVTLNRDLVAKDELLEGIKGYVTNVENTPEQLVVGRYRDLWHIEKAFRMAKSDLLARPVYHYKQSSIEAHLLIVFVGLCLAKAMELTTGLSMARIKSLLWNIHDVELVDPDGRKYQKREDATHPLIHKLLTPTPIAY